MKKIFFLLTLIVNLNAIEFEKNQPGDYDRGYSDGYNSLYLSMFKKEFEKITQATTTYRRAVERTVLEDGAIKGTCGRLKLESLNGRSPNYITGFEKGCLSKGAEIYQASFQIKSIEQKESSTYTFQGNSTIQGVIETVQYYGPPGYGEDPEYDKKITAYILKLSRPIKVVASNDDELNSIIVTKEIQLSTYELIKKVKIAAKTHKKIKVTGEFFSSHTGGHTSKLLIDVVSIEFLN